MGYDRLQQNKISFVGWIPHTAILDSHDQCYEKNNSVALFDLMGYVCNEPGLPSFQTSQRAGLVHFSTSCEHGNSFGSNAGIDFKRVAPNRVSYKAIYSKNGELTFDLGTLIL